MLMSDVGHRLFDFSARYKGNNVDSEVTHLSKNKESAHKNMPFILGVYRRRSSRLKRELWQRMFKFNVDDYKRRGCKEAHGFLEILRV